MRTGFSPQQHGFHFPNAFTNHLLADIAGARLPGGADITTYGRCGGMAYAALDLYALGIHPPTATALPGDGTPLADYILRRLFDSFLVVSALHFVSWTLYPNEETWFFKGVTRWTRDQFDRLRGELDQGRPQVLGLVRATDLAHLGDDHQVVAYGYEDGGGGAVTVFVYDNRYPDEEVSISVPGGGNQCTLTSSDGPEPWRGFFVQGYTAKPPEYLAEGTLYREGSTPGAHVVYGGAKFPVPDANAAARLGISLDAARMVPEGAMAYIADVPADGTLLREMDGGKVFWVKGGKAHLVPSAAVFVAMRLSDADVRVVADDAVAGIPQGEPLG